jgi:protoporphyrinogen IX oxidase
MLYAISKSVHLIAVMSWIASLFSVAVLLPFHVKTTEAVVKEKLVQIEHFLLKRLANPLMLVALILGVVTLVLNPVLLKAPWMHAKLLFVVFFCAYHGVLAKARRQLAEGTAVSAGKVKMLSVLPLVLTSIIVFLVIAKPF